jgi:hypothetical protein
VDQVKAALAKEQADVFTESISADVSEQLNAGHQVAYSAITSEQGFSASRVASGEDMVEGSQIVVDDSGTYGSQFLATKDGFVVVATAATDEGVAVAALTGKVEDEGKVDEEDEKETEDGK